MDTVTTEKKVKWEDAQKHIEALCALAGVDPADTTELHLSAKSGTTITATTLAFE